MTNLKKLFLLTILSAYTFHLKLNSMNQPLNLPIIKEDEKLTLVKDINLQDPIIFKGKCKIDGRGFELSFSPNTSITVAPNSILKLKNISIKDIDGKIKLTSPSSKILLSSGVTWKIKEIFVFSNGSFELIDGMFIIQKTNDDSHHKAFFLYRTAQKSSLKNCSILKLENVLFGYNPKIENPNNIELTPQSYLHLLNSNIILGQNLNLLNGGGIILQDTVQLLGNYHFNLNLNDENNSTANTPFILTPNTTLIKKNINLIYNDSK